MCVCERERGSVFLVDVFEHQGIPLKGQLYIRPSTLEQQVWRKRKEKKKKRKKSNRDKNERQTHSEMLLAVGNKWNS